MIPSRARILSLTLAGLLAACGGEEPAAEVLRPVRTTQVFSSGGERERAFAGTARAGTESRLSFRVPGTVLEVPVSVGDSVAAGGLIARLDAEDYRLQVREAEAAEAQAQAQAQNAESSYRRVRDLYEAGSASRADLDAALAGFQSSEATVRAAQQRVQLARQQLSYTRLTAPVAGAVAAVNVEPNENVQPGQMIVLLTSGTSIEVEVAVPEVLIARVSEGDPTEVRFDAVQGRSFPATVREVGVAATGAATTFPVTVVLGEADADLRSGMAAEVTFQFEATGGRDVFVVPSVAVAEDRDGRFVYVVEPGDPSGTGVVHRRPVTVGELTTLGLEVLEGLADGEHVVIAGVSRIEDGLRVRFDEAG